MAIALEEARKAAARGEVPVGACLVKDGEVIAQAGNRVEMQTDACAHAEILVLRQALAHFQQKQLQGCDIYITLEPCAMCAGAIALCRLRRVYYGARDEKMGFAEYFTSPACHHRLEVYEGLAGRESATLLRAFFDTLRR